MEIIIGADELILWLRKNGRALNISNKVLGKQILSLIEGLGGNKHTDNQDSLWDISAEAPAVNEFGLPKTSEQYLISVNILPDIYKAISTW